MKDCIYLTSTTPGKTWAVSASKGSNGTVIGSAIEGERDTSGPVFDSFKCTMFAARQVRVVTPAKIATRKALETAIAKVGDELERLGFWIPENA